MKELPKLDKDTPDQIRLDRIRLIRSDLIGSDLNLHSKLSTQLELESELLVSQKKRYMKSLKTSGRGF